MILRRSIIVVSSVCRRCIIGTSSFHRRYILVLSSHIIVSSTLHHPYSCIIVQSIRCCKNRKFPRCVVIHYSQICFCHADNSVLIFRNDYAGSSSGFFNRPWTQYQQGFGSPTALYWIGLDRLHEVSQRNCKIRFDFFHTEVELGTTPNITSSTSAILLPTTC